MPHERKTSLAAVRVGCVVHLVSGICGAAIGFALAPQDGYWGTLLGGFLWWFSGLGVGLIVGAFLAGRVARWVDNRKS